jgi:lipopolysaccharide/colanic/teichoic acid biosynthesis glycosyltransferase
MASIIQMRNGEITNTSSGKKSSESDFNTCCKLDLESVFDKPCFLELLRKERNRSQRSSTPLSLLLLKISGTQINNARILVDLFKVMKSILRETDVVGYLESDTIGVLLPYTDANGLSKIESKILKNYINPNLTINKATYPDQIFDSLANHGCVSPDVLRIMLEDTVKHSRYELALKRAVDIFGSIFALVIFAPFMLITAIVIKLDSPGPIIFKQKRLGKKGAAFTFFKFRSMQAGNNAQVHKDFVLKLINGNHNEINNGDAENPLYKIKEDPRITKVGKFIRKTSIDELPQLYNVLIGDMSMVGPRPPLAYEAEKYKSWHLNRILEMKPGITGLWQVDGRSRTDFNESVRLDLKYLQTWSMYLDMKILIKTVKEVLQCRGAM